MCGFDSSKVTKSYNFFCRVPRYIDASLHVHGHGNQNNFTLLNTGDYNSYVKLIMYNLKKVLEKKASRVNIQ